MTTYTETNDYKSSANHLADLITYQLQELSDATLAGQTPPDESLLIEPLTDLYACLEHLFHLATITRDPDAAGIEPTRGSVGGYLRLMSRLEDVIELASSLDEPWVEVDRQFQRFCRDMRLHFEDSSAVVGQSRW